MFQSKQYLEKHTGRYGSERATYLQLLVTEFQDTANDEFKEQILANLANFSYDPINYEWMRQLNVIDLFIDSLTESSEKLIEFAMAGLCNLCCDRLNQDVIIKNNGIGAIKKCLSSNNEETVLSAITTLYFLITPQTRAEIVTKGVVSALQAYSNAPSTRLKNLAKVFIEQHAQQQPQQRIHPPHHNNPNYHALQYNNNNNYNSNNYNPYNNAYQNYAGYAYVPNYNPLTFAQQPAHHDAAQPPPPGAEASPLPPGMEYPPTQ